MKSPLPLLAVAVALLPLAACNQPTAQDRANAAAANEAVAANEAAAASPLPPAVRSEKSFRCKDNSLAFVTFFEGDKQAIVKATQEETGTVLTAAKAGEPLTAAGGWTLKGDEKGITLTRPGKPAVTCHV